MNFEPRLRTSVSPMVWVSVALFILMGAMPATPQGADKPQAAPQGPDKPQAADKVSTASEAETLAVRQRAAEYWAARVARDYKMQWELSEPRLKGRMTADEYGQGKGAIQYLGYEVGDASIDGAFANVKVKVVISVALPKSQAKPVVRAATVDDAWVRVNGVWYRRADQPEATAPTQAPAGRL